MKNQLSFIFSLAMAFTLLFTGCEKEDPIIPESGSILPDKFSVEIPAGLSKQSSLKKSTEEVEPLNGNVIYRHLRTFIRSGEMGAEIVEGIIRHIVVFNINEPVSLSYESDEAGRTKNLEVIENSYFDGVNWEFQLSITDALSEEEEDGGLGLQIFWNRSPRKGIAILKPYNINRNEHADSPMAVFRIDYSEAGERGYDAHMLVAASGLELQHPLVNPFSLSTIKMFVGKNGDIIDIYGNSDHPNATFFTSDVGFNWAFVAAGYKNRELGVAEVGLPPSNLDEPSRSVLLGDYAIKNVFSDQIFELWPYIDSTDVEAYLYNTAAPGYFNQSGFVQGGTSPSGEYDRIGARLPELTPYNPKEVADMDIQFKSVRL